MLAFCACISLTSMSQTRNARTTQKSPATAQKKTTTSTPANNDGAEISLTGHIDYLKIGRDNDDAMPIDKKIRANYVLKLYSDPTDTRRPVRKTAILTCDIDWKTLADSDENIPVDWSWSGRNVEIVSQNNNGSTQYAIMDGNNGVAVVLPNFKSNGKVATMVFLYGGGNQITGLRPGMHIDDVARQLQKEVPGSRVVITSNKDKGLTEYVLQYFGENKVYDVTGDYHYEINNTEPYFTLWTDANNKLVKWFKLK